MLIRVIDGIYARNGELIVTIPLKPKHIDKCNQARNLSKNPYFIDAMNGIGYGSDIKYDVSLKEAKQLIKAWEQKDKEKAEIKARAIIIRKEFKRNRDKIKEAMLAAGLKQVCCIDGCESESPMSIDHILPISKGGTNDLSNLQFMCLEHNFHKGTKEVYHANI